MAPLVTNRGLLKRRRCQGGSDKLFAFSAYNCHRHWQFAVSCLGQLWAESFCVTKEKSQLCTFFLGLESHSCDTGIVGRVRWWIGLRISIEIGKERLE